MEKQYYLVSLNTCMAVLDKVLNCVNILEEKYIKVNCYPLKATMKYLI